MNNRKSRKISVIMPVYNGMPYLKEAVKSILEQSNQNFEFIIVDDASTDKSWNYLKSLKDKRLILVRNKKNLGVAVSLNIALKKATGAYVARMDADDVSLPIRFDEQIRFLQKNPSIDLCGTWIDLINEKGEIIGEKKYPTSAQKVKKAITWYAAVAHPTYMAKKAFYDNLGGYRANFDFAEDYDLLSRAKGQYKIVNIPKKLLLRRLQNNIRSRKDMKKMDQIELKTKLESLKRDGPTLYGLLALIKKSVITYILPAGLKLKIARILKLA